MKALTLLLAAGIFVAATDSSQGQIFGRGRSRSPGARVQVSAASPTTQEASKLMGLVRSQQQRLIRASFSETDCFTWEDLSALRSLVASGEFAKVIKADPGFAPVVESLKQATPAQRAGACNAALRVFRPTWRQMGRISSGGQTDAGQQGDVLVGREVVRLVREEVGG